MAGIKITSADKWFSMCIRERNNWTCERCRTDYRNNPSGLQCAHIFGRANKSVRLEPLNAFSLCSGCHMYFTANPMHFSGFVHQKLNGNYDVLNELSNDILRGKEYNQAIKNREAAKHYKAEYERMMEIRAQGVTGRLEFSGYL